MTLREQIGDAVYDQQKYNNGHVGDTVDAILALLRENITLEWDAEPECEYDDLGFKSWGEFSFDTIVATCKTAHYAIYQFSSDKYMWVDGTLDNIRYSTYRKPPNYERVEVPWFDSPESAKAALLEHYRNTIIAALGG